MKASAAAFPAVLIFHQKIKEKNTVTVSFPIFSFSASFKQIKDILGRSPLLPQFSRVSYFQLPDANLGFCMGNSNTKQPP